MQQQQLQHPDCFFNATRSSGIWEGLSFRHGCESIDDETRWSETSLVFSDTTGQKHQRGSSGKLSPWQGVGGAAAEVQEPPGAIAVLTGKGMSQWRGRAIPFEVRGYVTVKARQAGIAGLGGSKLLRITLIKRHLGAFSNVVQYEGE